MCSRDVMCCAMCCFDVRRAFFFYVSSIARLSESCLSYAHCAIRTIRGALPLGHDLKLVGVMKFLCPLGYAYQRGEIFYIPSSECLLELDCHCHLLDSTWVIEKYSVAA